MKQLNCFLYSLADGCKGIIRNFMMSFMSFSMLIGSLLVVGSLALVIVNIDSVIASIGDRNEVVIYVEESCTDEDINRISNQIMDIPHISEFNFVSRQTALEDMKENMADYASVLEGMEQDNPLRDGFRIRVDDPVNAETVSESLCQIEGVAKVRARTDVIESFIKTRNAVNIICIGLMVLLAGISMFIIMNTIKMSAYTRREEIGIMRMVGATKGMIRLSFVTEALLICVSGSLVAFFVTRLLYTELLVKALDNTGLFAVVPFRTTAGLLLASFVGAAALIGTVGSMLSINRYLKI